MKRILIWLACAISCAAQAPAPPLEVRVGDETVAPGGLVQLKLMMTDPRPISTGKMSLGLLDENFFADVLGVALFSDSGDVAGAALVQGGRVSTQFILDPRFTLPGRTFGQDGDYPLMTVVVRTKAAAGTSTQVTIDPGASFWAWLGLNISGTVKPGTITTGGVLSVSNVIPGAGLLPAGSIVKVLGTGFDANTVIQVDNLSLSVKFVNSGEMDLTLAQATDMQGKRIRVKNKDGSQVTYFSYLRATTFGDSSKTLLKQTTPIFANALPGGSLPVSAAQSTYTGLALQNGNQTPANVSLDLLSATGDLLARTAFSLPGGMRYVRELGEIFGVATLQPGSSVRVTPDPPIQMLGLIADDNAHSVTPLNLTASVSPSLQLTAAPQALTFSYKIGEPQPPSQALTLTLAGATVPFSVTQSPPAAWLTVSPASGTAPTALSVSANPAGLAAGTYTTNINISPTGGSAIPITVTLVVTGPNTPVISAIVNAANQQTGALSPGEIVTLYGQFPGVPATNLALDSSGKVAALLSGARVLFDGVPAPLTYVSSTQINAVVPYEIADSGSTRVQAELAGVLSPSLALPVAPSAPAIFTLDSSGFGSGAVLNQDFSVNSASKPAARLSGISIYATGEGRTSPQGVTGSVAGSNLKTPVLDVTATIGGQPADVLYAGSAPGLVSGVLQVNVRVPDSAPSGSTVPIVIRVGAATSVSGVTIAVQ